MTLFFREFQVSFSCEAMVSDTVWGLLLSESRFLGHSSVCSRRGAD